MTATKRGRKGKLNGGKPASSGKLARRFRGGPPAHREAVRRAKELEARLKRQKQVWQLFTGPDELTLDQIGARLGVSGKTVFYDRKAVIDRMIASGLLDADLRRIKVDSQLSAVVRAHWSKLGDPRHSAIVLQAQRDIRQLNGLDLEKKDAYSYEQMVTALRAMAAVFLEVVSDVEARRLYAAGIRRRLGPALAPPIDVASQKPPDGESES